MKRTFRKVCRRCEEEFRATGSKQLFCQSCASVRLECQICERQFEVTRFKYEHSLSRNKDQKLFCSRRCSSTYAASQSGKNRYYAHCDKCGKVTNHYAGEQCWNCICTSEERLRISSITGSKNITRWNQSEEGRRFRNSERMREISRRNMTRWNKSEEGQEHIQRNLKRIHETHLVEFNRSEAGRQHLQRVRQKRIQSVLARLNQAYRDGVIPPITFQEQTLDTIEYDSFSKHSGVEGVWAVWSGDTCLDVAQTIDIGKEMNLFLRKIRAGRIEKYARMAEFERIEFRLVTTDRTKNLDIVEISYAMENGALYWNPSPVQLSLFNRIKGMTAAELLEFVNKE